MYKKWLRVDVFFGLIPGLLILDGVIIWQHSHKSIAQPRSQISKPAAVAPKAPQTYTYHSKLLFMGDTMLARTIGENIVAGDNPYKYVQPTLNGYDFRIANIETTIADPATTNRADGKLYTFNAPLASMQTLKAARINVASLANNHTMDFGSAALLNMISNFTSAGVVPVGAGKNSDDAFAPVIVDVPLTADSTKSPNEHIRIAFLAANDIENTYTVAASSSPGSAYFDDARLAASIQAARGTEKADLVVVIPHWGIEYQTVPSDRQIEWGHFFIDHGADLVIGGHPHVVQPTESYKGKYIVYSMGNFIFDGMSGNALDGEMIGVNVRVKAEGIAHSVTFDAPTAIATHIDDQGYPKLK
jgi:poly-gamma-glutamate capsule biosynthesis protein CapA/YwtB (metallophosphatase superfamily)